jgi:L-ascorbate metabolism protein UlaG (beta-lactamase superfamily)
MEAHRLEMTIAIVLLAFVLGVSFVACQPAQPARISVKWLGHASFMIRGEGKVIYIDPYEGEYKEKADIILVSHSHSDHCDTSKIQMIRRDDTVVVAPANCIEKIGGSVRSLKPGENLTVGAITIEAVEAYNYKRFRSPGNPYHPKGFGVGYLVTIGSKTIYHAGDTDFIEEMKSLKNVHLALLPSGDVYTMDNKEAAEAALAINPKYVIPMHRWKTDPTEFRKEVEAKSQIKVILLQPGETFELE